MHEPRDPGNALPVKRELRVVDDLAGAALELFLEESPQTVLLTGGDTPLPFYERLATLDYPWEDVEFFFSDERCVPDIDQRSNFRMANVALLSKVDAARYPMDGENCNADGYEEKLRERFGERPWFDFAVYGLGPDGHTASLFPRMPEVEVTDRWVVEVPQAGWEPYVPRVSLTMPVLSAASVGVFLVSDETKREPLRRLLAEEDIPAARLTPKRLVVLADHGAAPR
jgi:6-phosphogluconolactonase